MVPCSWQATRHQERMQKRNRRRTEWPAARPLPYTRPRLRPRARKAIAILFDLQTKSGGVGAAPHEKIASHFLNQTGLLYRMVDFKGEGEAGKDGTTHWIQWSIQC